MDVPKDFTVKLLEPGFNFIGEFVKLEKGNLVGSHIQLYVIGGSDFDITMYIQEGMNQPKLTDLAKSTTKNISYQTNTYLRVSLDEINRIAKNGQNYSYWLHISGTPRETGIVLDGFEQVNDGYTLTNAKINFLVER